MGSAWTCGCRGGKIIPLRPDIRRPTEAGQPRVAPRDPPVKAAKERCSEPQQLSLFDDPPDR